MPPPATMTLLGKIFAELTKRGEMKGAAGNVSPSAAL
jgi:hypothetical protein